MTESGTKIITGYYAKCIDCSYEGQLRVTRTEAIVDADNHEKKNMYHHADILILRSEPKLNNN
jgi:hypothetical protein